MTAVQRELMTAVQEKLNFTGICMLFHICSWYSFRGSVLHDSLLYSLLHHLHGLVAHGLGLMVHSLCLAVHSLGLAVQAILVNCLTVQETPVDELYGLLAHDLQRAILWVVDVLGGVLHLLGGAVQCLLDGGVLAVVVVVAAVAVAAVAVVAVVEMVAMVVAAVVTLLRVMLHVDQGEEKALEIQVKSSEMSETISGFSVGYYIERKVMLPT